MRAQGPPRARTGRRALVRYVLAWAAAGGLLVVAAVALLGRGEDGDEVALPPVREIELTVAARDARCSLVPAGRGAPGLPVAGPSAAPARPGVYSRPPPPAALIGSLRRGLVVIHHRPDLPGEARVLLEAVQRTMPGGTIVTPNGTMPFVVAVTAWRRAVGCPAAGTRTLDAVRLFLGRFVGAGPDVAP